MNGIDLQRLFLNLAAKLLGPQGVAWRDERVYALN
jgi:hypothetical protein